MDVKQERHAKNIAARMGFSALFATWLIGAVLSSVPFEKKQYSEVNAVSSAPLLRENHNQKLIAVQSLENIYAEFNSNTPKKENNTVFSASPNRWWKSHTTVALLQGKWWHQHSASSRRIVQAERIATANLRPLAKIAVTALKDEPVAGRTLLVGPPKIKRGTIGLLERASIGGLQSKEFANTEQAGALAALVGTASMGRQSLLKPAASLATSKPLSNVRFAGLSRLDWQSLLRGATPGLPILARYGEEATGLFDKNNTGMSVSGPKRLNRDLGQGLQARVRAEQCRADDIAGWSGITLLEKHKELLRQADTRGDNVSAMLAARLKIKGFVPGAPIFMRIFKDRSLLEVWLEKDGRYALFHTYKICRWSGTFGPKLYEGDRQSPEGFYLVDDQLFNRRSWKWKGSFSIGYPNAYDKLHGRTGSLILVHGGCTSSGCFAMTNPVIKEVHELAQLARDQGQEKFAVHVFPFRLTSANMKRHKNSPWIGFWNNLKEGYDLFEKSKSLPGVRVCNKRYVFAIDGEESAAANDQHCYGLQAFIPGWQPARRVARRGRGRRRAYRGRTLGSRTRCNYNRPSCRKWIALRNKKRLRHAVRKNRGKVRARRVVRRTVSKRRRALMRRARAIGRKRKAKSKRK